MKNPANTGRNHSAPSLRTPRAADLLYSEVPSEEQMQNGLVQKWTLFSPVSPSLDGLLKKPARLSTNYIIGSSYC